MTLTTLASTDFHISLAAEPIFNIGSFQVMNSHTLGLIGVIIVIAVLFYSRYMLANGRYNRFVGLMQWMFEGLYSTAVEVIGDKATARRIYPLAFTIFITVLATYWLSILPGIGPITVDGVPIFRALVADLNFTLAIAIITIVTAQIYAIRVHGLFGNVRRYIKNPLKDPIGAFEGFLELIGEVSRMLTLSLRLFGNAFVGEVLLVIIAVLSSYLASLTLPFVMAFELFIGFIQAYVFFMLTLVFTSLAIASHDSHDSSDHSKLDHPEAHPKPLQQE